MRWMVAPSYAHATIEKVNEDTHKAYIKEKCPRCGGLGIVVARVENGQMIPIPVDGGICYKCKGEKYIYRWVKAYTEDEYAAYVKSREKAKEKKAEQEELRRQHLLDESEKNKENKLRELGYDPMNPVVYIAAGGNTYAIKDELKAAGFRFTKPLGWYNTHEVAVPAPYYLLAIAFDDLYTWFPLSQTITLNETAEQVVKAKIEENLPESESEYLGEEKERLRDLHVTVSAIHTTEGFYGTTFIYTFEMNKNILVWMTSSCKDIEVGEEVSLTGTVKAHKEYRKVKQTVLSRCIIKKEA